MRMLHIISKWRWKIEMNTSDSNIVGYDRNCERRRCLSKGNVPPCMMESCVNILLSFLAVTILLWLPLLLYCFWLCNCFLSCESSYPQSFFLSLTLPLLDSISNLFLDSLTPHFISKPSPITTCSSQHYFSIKLSHQLHFKLHFSNTLSHGIIYVLVRTHHNITSSFILFNLYFFADLFFSFLIISLLCLYIS